MFTQNNVNQYRRILAWFVSVWLPRYFTRLGHSIRLGRYSIPCLVLLFSIGSNVALAGTFTVFGPQSFNRASNKPVTVAESFSVLNPNTTYTLYLNSDRISSAGILINNIEIFGQNDFNQQVNSLSKEVALNKSNQLSVKLDGKPGGSVTIEILGIDNDPPVITASVNPQPSGSGWNTTSVTVSFECSDTISGVKECPAPVFVSKEGAGQVITGTATDNAGNTAVASVTLNIDTIKPTVNYTLTPVPNVNEWNNSDVEINFICSDDGSGIADCTAPITVTTEGGNQQFSGIAKDIAGNTETVSVLLNIDKVLPLVEGSISPAANANGWNNTDVTASFSCNDTLSGIEHCTSPVSVVTEGLAQTVKGTAQDKAGNIATTDISVNIDKTPPSITAIADTPANTAGWYKANVTVRFECVDAMSGIASCPVPIVVETEAAGQVISGTAIDSAGNTATDSITLNIDKTPPTATTNAIPVANSSGWNNVDVVVNFSCTDTGSGVATCPATQTVTTEGSDQQITGTATDIAGNTVSITHKIGLDKTLPVITPSASPVANANGWNNTDVTVTFGCADNQSGIASCKTPIIVNSEGANQIIDGTAVDVAGNTAATSVVLNIDKTIPVINIVSPVSGSELIENPPTISISYSDNSEIDPSTLKVSANGQSLQVQCQTTASGAQCTPASEFTEGSIAIIVSVDDIANNSASSQATYTIDSDSDNDGVPDESDLCTGTANGEAVDTVGCPEAQNDIDGDGQINDNDLFPTDPKEWADLDGDSIGDNSDPDIDGDGVANESDAFPEDPTRVKLPIVTIDSPATLTTFGNNPIEVKGSTDTTGTLTVNGAAVIPNDGLYTANVVLEEGHNTIVTRLVAGDGIISTASISVSLDLTPPYITVDSHSEGQVVRTPMVAISGLVNDIVRGTVEGSQANVTVNDVEAEISNRSYLATDVTLNEGENLIQIVAADQVGNSATKNLKLIYQPAVGKHLEVADGQNQTALIQEVLIKPLSVKVLDDSNQPVGDKNVVFRVIQGSGILGIDAELTGRGVVVKTNTLGIASTKYQLGLRSGTGNHKVRARVVGYDDEIIFYASATANTGDQLSVNSGNNQRGGTHQPLPAPFVVAVTDVGKNVVKGASVRFDVTRGGGQFENDSQSITVITDSDGRASAHYSLGGITGLDKQTVTATMLDGPAGEIVTAGFSASGSIPGDAGATTITGVVVDNQDQPIPGVTIRVDGTNRQAIAEQNGQFEITEAPVGPVHLIADGSTATVEGEFPSLSYNVVTVSGVDNPLASPIYMVKLNTLGAVYAGSTDVEIELDEVPGFKLQIPAGSVTFPDGSKEGYISVTPVNANKVPMAPPNGMQPQFIVTIQPTGAKFDPPAPLTLPNVDGHLAGAQVEMFSYDHDLEEFVTIGLGTVSEDGTVVNTNKGIGVIKAGWHSGAQPAGDGCVSGPPQCNDYCYIPEDGCFGGCTVDSDKALQEQVLGDCSIATCGGDKEYNEDIPPIETDVKNDCRKPGCDSGSPRDVIDDSDKPSEDTNVKYDCQKLDCEDGFEVEVPDDNDISEKNGKCKKCSEGDLVTDTGKIGLRCGDDTLEQECMICNKGRCEVPDCKAEKGKMTTSLGNEILGKLVENIGSKLSSNIFVNVDVSGITIETFSEKGQECCKDCTQPQRAVDYTIEGARATGSAYIVAVMGVATKLPTREILGLLKVSGVIEFGLGGRAKLAVSGSYSSKRSACEESGCVTAALGVKTSFFVGALGLFKLKVESCIDFDYQDCTKVFAVTGEANSGFMLPVNGNAKAFIGDACTKSSCLGYYIGGIDFVANVKAEIEIGAIKRSYSAEVIEHLADPIAENDC